MKQSPVGQAVVRADAVLKVTGKAQYAAEIPVSNPAYAVIVTSAVGKGKLTEIGAAAAARVPGVLHVLTHSNAPNLPGANTKQNPQDRLLQLLQNDDVL
jgi:xanthine dehydrogenase YagR molybdenum-binding subunit